jgi:hypothetical protein
LQKSEERHYAYQSTNQTWSHANEGIVASQVHSAAAVALDSNLVIPYELRMLFAMGYDPCLMFWRMVVLSLERVPLSWQ